jgi:putative DNA methylase
LAVARAVIFAQLVDDPGSVPEDFPTPASQEKERQRLFRLIEKLVLWENTTNEDVLNRARTEIKRSWARWCKRSGEDPHKLPPFHDPFAGGGALPLEAQRLGLEAHASDLNPVAVMINKAMIEIPPRFDGHPPVNPEVRKDKQLFKQTWCGAAGLAEDVRYYGQWMRDEAEKRIGHLYPKLKISAGTAKDRPDLNSYVGKDLTVIAWFWARTVESSNPAYRGCHVPLVSSFWVSTKVGKEAWVEPVIDGKTYRFEVRYGKPLDPVGVDNGTKLGRGANFRCLLSQSPLSPDYIKAEGVAGRMGLRMMAIVAEGDNGRVYLSPTKEHEEAIRQAKPTWIPEQDLPNDPRNFWTVSYGLTKFADLFTPRQLVAMTTFADLVADGRKKVLGDAEKGTAFSSVGISLREGGTGAAAYAEAVSVYLACALGRLASYNNTICHWNMKGGSVAQIFSRQAIPMSWDFIEVAPLQKMSGNWIGGVGWISDVFANIECSLQPGVVIQADACQRGLTRDTIVSTDPPYYDNISYADLSDFFYVWLRPALKVVFPDLFSTLAVPKVQELIATPYRHGSKEKAEEFFLGGMTRAMHRIVQNAHPAPPVTIYYAFKQSESESDGGAASTGWETFLNAVIGAGFIVNGTWPMRTEKQGRMTCYETNALASSIVLVCRPRSGDAPTTTRKEFLATLRRELPAALRHLQQGNIAPVDLAQASIGPGMAVFSRFSKILETDGSLMKVRTALQLINQTLDEVLAEQEGDFDPETAWAVAWFEQFGFNDGPFGDAETLCKAKNTALNALADAGIVRAGGGKARLLRVDELPVDWDPATDKRRTIWEMVHHLVRVLHTGGETAAAVLVVSLGAPAQAARELAYRLYSVCEKRKRATEALSYNALVQSWPEIMRLARVPPGALGPVEQELGLL